MIRSSTIWYIIQKYIPKRQWVSSEDIYDLVESHTRLDKEDVKPQSPNSRIAQWKLVVRNVLVERVHTGNLKWVKDRNARQS